MRVCANAHAHANPQVSDKETRMIWTERRRRRSSKKKNLKRKCDAWFYLKVNDLLRNNNLIYLSFYLYINKCWKKKSRWIPIPTDILISDYHIEIYVHFACPYQKLTVVILKYGNLKRKKNAFSFFSLTRNSIFGISLGVRF